MLYMYVLPGTEYICPHFPPYHTYTCSVPHYLWLMKTKTAYNYLLQTYLSSYQYVYQVKMVTLGISSEGQETLLPKYGLATCQAVSTLPARRRGARGGSGVETSPSPQARSSTPSMCVHDCKRSTDRLVRIRLRLQTPHSSA